MRIIVCGGRDYNDAVVVGAVLSRVVNWQQDIIVHGAARGADSLAGEWAQKYGVAYEDFPAEWDKHGKAA